MLKTIKLNAISITIKRLKVVKKKNIEFVSAFDLADLCMRYELIRKASIAIIKNNVFIVTNKEYEYGSPTIYELSQKPK
ncbi:MAG: hypothetical protein PHW82_09030 [Bacteroidales bacterium]|nr:hypothetical protein [Bacteroidales bacterium]